MHAANTLISRLFSGVFVHVIDIPKSHDLPQSQQIQEMAQSAPDPFLGVGSRHETSVRAVVNGNGILSCTYGLLHKFLIVSGKRCFAIINVCPPTSIKLCSDDITNSKLHKHLIVLNNPRCDIYYVKPHLHQAFKALSKVVHYSYCTCKRGGNSRAQMKLCWYIINTCPVAIYFSVVVR